jgi:Zn finger protein HypA/HybF involved in hydrogenase expression
MRNIGLREYIVNNSKNHIKKVKTKLYCEKGNHNWEHGIWGSAFVDNLDGTFSLWEIGVRTCQTCKRHEMNLKNGWEEAKKGLTINDLK